MFSMLKTKIYPGSAVLLTDCYRISEVATSRLSQEALVSSMVSFLTAMTPTAHKLCILAV